MRLNLALAACVVFVGCGHVSQKAHTSSADVLIGIAANVLGKTAVFCLKGDQETRLQLEAGSVVKMRSRGFDATEGRAVIPSSDSYSPEELARFLHGAGFRSITEITYGVAVASGNAHENIEFETHWISQAGEKHYHTTRMGLDAALRTLIDSL